MTFVCRAMQSFLKTLCAVSLAFLLVGCGSSGKDLSDEKARAESVSKELRDRLSTSQIDR